MRYITLASLIRKLPKSWAEKRNTNEQQKADYENLMDRLRNIRLAAPGDEANMLVCTSCYNYKSLHHRWRELTGRSVQGKPSVPRSVNSKLPFDGYRWRRRNLKKPVVTPTGGNVIQFNCLFPGCTCVKSVEFAPDNEEQYTITYPEGPHNHDPPLLKPTEGDEEGAGPESGSQDAEGRWDDHEGGESKAEGGEDVNTTLGSGATKTSAKPATFRAQYQLPCDGYKWRKRGTILIRGHTHPRYYYQCTTPNCPAKKAVNRSLEAEDTLIITYYGGEHNHAPVMATAPPVTDHGYRFVVESDQIVPGANIPVPLVEEAPAPTDRAAGALRVPMSTVCCCCDVQKSTSRHVTLACVIQNVAQSWAEKAGTTQEEITDYNVLMETLEAIQEQGPRPHDDGALSACMSCFNRLKKTRKWPFTHGKEPEEEVAVPVTRGTRKRSRSPHPASRPSKVPALDGGAWGALPGAGTEGEAGDGMHGQLGEEALQMHGDLGMTGLVVEGPEEGLQYMDPMGLGYMEGNGDGNGSVQYMDQEGTHMEGDMHGQEGMYVVQGLHGATPEADGAGEYQQDGGADEPYDENTQTGELGSEDDEDWEEDDEDGSKEGGVRSAGHLSRICSCCNQGEHTKRRVSIVALINKLPKSFAARNPAPTPEEQEDFDDLIQRLQAVYDAGPRDFDDGALSVCTSCYNYKSLHYRWREPLGGNRRLERIKRPMRRSVLSSTCCACGQTNCRKQASLPTLKRNIDKTWSTKISPSREEIADYHRLIRKLDEIMEMGPQDGFDPSLCKSCYDYKRIHLRWKDNSRSIKGFTRKLDDGNYWNYDYSNSSMEDLRPKDNKTKQPSPRFGAYKNLPGTDHNAWKAMGGLSPKRPSEEAKKVSLSGDFDMSALATASFHNMLPGGLAKAGVSDSLQVTPHTYDTSHFGQDDSTHVTPASLVLGTNRISGTHAQTLAVASGMGALTAGGSLAGGAMAGGLVGADGELYEAAPVMEGLDVYEVPEGYEIVGYEGEEGYELSLGEQGLTQEQWEMLVEQQRQLQVLKTLAGRLH